MNLLKCEKVKRLKIVLLLCFALFWMFGIFKLSNMNTTNSNGKSIEIIGMFIEDALDITNEYGITNSYPSNQKVQRASRLINAPMRKVMHASVYFGLAFFIIIVLDIIFDNKKYGYSIFLAFLICVLFAISDEFHQTFVNGRTGRILDVFIDSLGSIVGIFFYSTYHIVYILGYKRAKNENIQVS